QLREGLLVEAAVLGHALPRALDELVLGPARLGHADDGRVQPSALDELLQGGEDLLVGEVAGGAEEDQRVRAGLLAHFFSTCPPKPKRMAESALFWNSSSPREAKPSTSDAVSTQAGT